MLEVKPTACQNWTKWQESCCQHCFKSIC